VSVTFGTLESLKLLKPLKPGRNFYNPEPPGLCTPGTSGTPELLETCCIFVMTLCRQFGNSVKTKKIDLLY